MSLGTLSNLARGVGNIHDGFAEVILEPQDYLNFILNRNFQQLSTNDDVKGKSAAAPPAKTFFTRRGDLFLFSEKKFNARDAAVAADKKKRLEDNSFQGLEWNTIGDFTNTILAYGSSHATPELLPSKGVHKRRDRHIRPGFSAKRYLSSWHKNFQDTFLPVMLEKGLINPNSLFEQNQLLPHIKHRINDDLTRYPMPYRLLKQMLLSPGSLSGFSFLRQRSTQTSQSNRSLTGFQSSPSHMTTMQTHNNTEIGPTEWQTNQVDSSSVSTGGGTRKHGDVISRDGIETDRIELRDKDGVAIDYKEMDKETKTNVLADLLLKSALSHAIKRGDMSLKDYLRSLLPEDEQDPQTVNQQQPSAMPSDKKGAFGPVELRMAGEHVKLPAITGTTVPFVSNTEIDSKDKEEQSEQKVDQMFPPIISSSLSLQPLLHQRESHSARVPLTLNSLEDQKQQRRKSKSGVLGRRSFEVDGVGSPGPTLPRLAFEENGGEGIFATKARGEVKVMELSANDMRPVEWQIIENKRDMERTNSDSSLSRSYNDHQRQSLRSLNSTPSKSTNDLNSRGEVGAPGFSSTNFHVHSTASTATKANTPMTDSAAAGASSGSASVASKLLLDTDLMQMLSNQVRNIAKKVIEGSDKTGNDLTRDAKLAAKQFLRQKNHPSAAGQPSALLQSLVEEHSSTTSPPSPTARPRAPPAGSTSHSSRDHQLPSVCWIMIGLRKERTNFDRLSLSLTAILTAAESKL